MERTDIFRVQTFIPSFAACFTLVKLGVYVALNSKVQLLFMFWRLDTKHQIYLKSISVKSLKVFRVNSVFLRVCCLSWTPGQFFQSFFCFVYLTCWSAGLAGLVLGEDEEPRAISISNPVVHMETGSPANTGKHNYTIKWLKYPQ